MTVVLAVFAAGFVLATIVAPWVDARRAQRRDARFARAHQCRVVTPPRFDGGPRRADPSPRPRRREGAA